LDSNGTIYQIDIPSAAGTRAEGINDNGEIVGTYFDANHNEHGFTTTVADVKLVVPLASQTSGAAIGASSILSARPDIAAMSNSTIGFLPGANQTQVGSGNDIMNGNAISDAFVFKPTFGRDMIRNSMSPARSTTRTTCLTANSSSTGAYLRLSWSGQQITWSLRLTEMRWSIRSLKLSCY